MTEARAARTVGRFELCQEIASGGMASVWAARTVGPGGFVRVCAVKCVHPHLVKKRAFVEMFLDEARIAARVNHPNVCQVFDYGEEDGKPFIAMEFLAGTSLSGVLRAFPRDGSNTASDRVRPACAIVAEAAHGLHAAHELRGPDAELLEVVHRDISPQNLFVTFEGLVKVVDFGIASARDKVHETNTGEVKGKFAYMAPEQMRGLPVDRRADVWSLGVVLWEMLTCKRLFRRNSQPETMEAVLRARIPPPSTVCEGIPGAVDEVVRRALCRDADQRYASAREMARDLEVALESFSTPWTRAHLEEWVNALLPAGRSAATTLIGSVRSMQTNSDASAPREAPIQTAVTVAATPRADTSEDGTDTISDPFVVGPEHSEPAEAPPRATRFVVGAIALVVVSLAVGWGVARWGAETPAPTANSASPDGSPETVADRTEVRPPPPAEPAAPVPLEDASDSGPPDDGPPSTQPRGLDRSDAGAEAAAVGRPRIRRPAISRTREPPNTNTTAPTPVPAMPEPTGEGCVRVALGVTARIDRTVVEGPRVHRLPAGRHSIAVLHGDRVVRERTVVVQPGSQCHRVLP